MFTQDFLLKSITVKGEISNCRYHPSGHIYFTMKDSGGAISCVMFRGDRDRGGLKFQMKEGQQVKVSGTVDVYERDGKYQLYARRIELDGEGALFEKFEELKKRLAESGMFADECEGHYFLFISPCFKVKEFSCKRQFITLKNFPEFFCSVSVHIFVFKFP